ncbi:MAG: PilZ domain-containing protein [Candidatus Hydrogenedentes bacterium]|jgi:hypothetical protein|nr:PilZ domain-containing protein [Candidatus Hydrogenedentota bacterium]
MSQGTGNKRKYPRSNTGFKKVETKADPTLLNHVDNISGNGVLCHTNRPVPVMTKMSVSMELPTLEDHQIEAEGIVVRCEPDGEDADAFKLAILYTKLSDEDHQAICRYVDQDIAQAS